MRRTGIWVSVSTIFTLLNAFSAGMYVRDPMHAGSHGALALVGVVWTWWLLARAFRREPAQLTSGDARLERLQQSMDAVALEVERLGEASRYSAKLAAEKKEQAR